MVLWGQWNSNAREAVEGMSALTVILSTSGNIALGHAAIRGWRTPNDYSRQPAYMTFDSTIEDVTYVTIMRNSTFLVRYLALAEVQLLRYSECLQGPGPTTHLPSARNRAPARGQCLLHACWCLVCVQQAQMSGSFLHTAWHHGSITNVACMLSVAVLHCEHPMGWHT